MAAIGGFVVCSSGFMGTKLNHRLFDCWITVRFPEKEMAYLLGVGMIPVQVGVCQPFANYSSNKRDERSHHHNWLLRFLPDQYRRVFNGGQIWSCSCSSVER